MANKNVVQQGLIERAAMAVLRRLNIDSTGRLRVGDATVSSLPTLSTCTTLTNLTNWGLSTATAKSQWESHQAFQQGFRRNLVQS